VGGNIVKWGFWPSLYVSALLLGKCASAASIEKCESARKLHFEEVGQSDSRLVPFFVETAPKEKSSAKSSIIVDNRKFAEILSLCCRQGTYEPAKTNGETTHEIVTIYLEDGSTEDLILPAATTDEIVKILTTSRKS
jgi:hypothetical protein